MTQRFRASVVAFALLVAGCGSMAAPAPPPVLAGGGGVKFTRKPLSVGTVIVTHERNETNLEMDITVDARARHSSSVIVETIDRRAEVLAMDPDGAPTRMKVVYQAHHKEETGKGVSPTPVEGKTYVLEGHGAALPAVTDASGSPASEAEAKVVTTDFKHLGRPDPFWRGLPERPLTPSEPLDDMEKVVLADAASDGLDHVELHFEGERDVRGLPGGVFAVAVSGKVGGDVHVTAKGKVTLLLASGWEALADADFPIDFSQQQTRDGSAVSIVGHGNAHLHKETSYEGRQ